jgi:hypothetical protein
MKIWISAFIPKTIPSYTLPMPNGSGKTMIPGPTAINDCFLTDQRDFSDNPTASSRMRLTVDIDMSSLQIQSWQPHCDNTVKVDCGNGIAACNQTPDVSGLKVENISTNGSVLVLSFTGGAGNPCVPVVAPEINWDIKIEVRKTGATAASVSVLAGSLVEPFPAFEMYVRWNGATKTLFRRSPDPGTSPWNLFGPPNKPISGSAVFP